VRRLAAIVASSTLLLAASAAAAPNPANQASLEKTVRYLQNAQQLSGGFAASGEPSQITSAWTAIALAAAGINPQDQRRPGGVDAFSYLASHYRQGIEESECAPIACTTTLERELMVVNASGANPHDFGGVDLVAELLPRARHDGSFPHVPGGQPGVNDTIFAVFALVPIGELATQAAIQPAAEWIESIQHANGGWAWSATSTQDEVDMTGAAIQALIAAGRGRNAAVEEGIEYLRDAQNPDGGFPEFPGTPESNVASTAWATQAIWAVGENPEDWRTGSGMQTAEPLDYMESLQDADGHIRWKRSQDLNGIWMTAYCSVALGGDNWPIPPAPRSIPAAAPPEPGQGEGIQSGEGVIAGGGGRGAPFFSRPKPQSRGKTPGGARVLESKGGKPRNHSKTRRGSNAKQPTQTQRTEAASAAESARASAARGSDPGSGEGRGGGARVPLDARGGASLGSGPGAGSAGGGAGGGGSVPRALAAAGGGATVGAGGGQEVTGALIGSVDSPRGGLHFGAPGLHGAGVAGGDKEVVAIGIGAVALLVALAGAGLERRRQEAVL
jgi:Squalene-hopene cyclase C-terminal domain/Prenyltransferase and squalene oxidase repeat